MNEHTEELLFTVIKDQFFTEVFRLPASEAYRLAPGSDTLQ